VDSEKQMPRWRRCRSRSHYYPTCRQGPQQKVMKGEGFWTGLMSPMMRIQSESEVLKRALRRLEWFGEVERNLTSSVKRSSWWWDERRAVLV
jgi:hypothetical protein